MVWQVKTLAAMPENLYSISRTHMVSGGSLLPHIVL